jgi:hypothetical protein
MANEIINGGIISDGRPRNKDDYSYIEYGLINGPDGEKYIFWNIDELPTNLNDKVNFQLYQNLTEFNSSGVKKSLDIYKII